MKKLALASLLFVVGCTTPHDYTDPLDPSGVTLVQLEQHAQDVATHYQAYNQVYGVIWQSRYTDPSLPTPDRYGSGGDSCLFTGFKIAADVYRYRVTGKLEDLEKVKQSLQGLYILTHITGKRGVLARCAFPVSDGAKWNYPDGWQDDVDKQFGGIAPTPVANPFTPGVNFPEMFYYTRATKDQMTGVVLGTAVAWELLKAVNPADAPLVDKCREVTAQIVSDVYAQLDEYNFLIRDQKGENDTSADKVDGLLKAALLSVYKEVLAVTDPPAAGPIKDEFYTLLGSVLPEPGDYFAIFSSYTQYFAWNLRYSRALTIFLTNDDPSVKSKVGAWCNDFLWPHVKNHQSAWFIYINNVVSPGSGELAAGNLSVRSLSLRPIKGRNSPLAGDSRKPNVFEVLFTDISKFVLPPHLRKDTDYWTWQKEPWDTGSGSPNDVSKQDPTGLDYLMVYWMGRYYGFLN